MKIKDEWFKKNFEQKFFLYCRDSNFEVKKFGQLENKSYIYKRIKITEI